MATEKRSTRLRRFAALLCVVLWPCLSVAGSPKLGWAGGDADQINGSNASWYYRWWHDIPASANGAVADFIPLIKYTNNLQSKLDSINSIPNVDTVLVLNEPERPEQSNVSVAEAISIWPQVQSNLPGKTLVSPAVSDNAAGRAWLDSFFGQVNALNSNANPSDDLRVDAVAFHWYGASSPNATAAANSFLNRVDYYYQTYNLPVWITEFAIHDWDGLYTDQQILNANAQFLDIVIPELESRSYVEKYAYYSFFDDATAFSGSPITPTVVGDVYAGTLGANETRDLAGVSIGTDIVYLRGGVLRNSGPAIPDALRAIDALEGSSTISADNDWSTMNLRTSYMNVRPGATLHKTGAAAIDVYGAISQEGTLHVAEGTLRLIDGVFSGSDGTTKVDSGATLGLSQQGGRGSHAFPSHTLEVGGRVEGAFRMLSGSLLKTSGTAAEFASNVTLNASVLDVGGPGLETGAPTVQPVTAGLKLNYDASLDTPGDNLWSDANGSSDSFTFSQAASPIAISDATFPTITSAYSIPSTGGGQGLNQYFETDGPRSRQDASFEVVFNVSDLAAGVDQVLFEAGGATLGVAMVLNNNSLLFNVDGQGTDINLTKTLDAGWHQAVGVIDLDGSGDTITLYVDGEVARTLTEQNVVDWAGGNLAGIGVGASSVTGVGVSTGTTFKGDMAVVRYYQNTALSGAQVQQNFLALSDAPPKVAALATFEGDLRLEASSQLRFDLGEGGVADKVVVDGALVLTSGSLVVGYDGSAGPQAGDAYDLLDFNASQGAFSSISLPTLDAGLMWNTDRLLVDGVLLVTLAGDYNGDGTVDVADYTVWRDLDGQSVPTGTRADGNGDGMVNAFDYQVWIANYGSSVAGMTQAIPEPGCLAIIAIGLMSLARRRSRPFDVHLSESCDDF